jgi:topoisomerase-4 subunit B
MYILDLCLSFQVQLPIMSVVGVSVSAFANFIGPDIRLQPIIMDPNNPIPKLLEYYMGKNTPQRQEDIINNLRIEKDLPEALIV